MERGRWLWPLPGGTKNYVQTLHRILQKVRDAHPTEPQLVQWFKAEYQLAGQKTPLRYIQLVETNLGLIEKRNDSLAISKEATYFLETDDSTIIFKILFDKILGISELLLILSNGRLKIRQIRSALNDACRVQWNSKNPTIWRLNWLQCLGYLSVQSGYWSLAQKGVEVASRLRDVRQAISNRAEQSQSQIVSSEPQISTLTTLPPLQLDDLENVLIHVKYLDRIARRDQTLKIEPYQNVLEDVVLAIWKLLQLDIEQRGHTTSGSAEPDGIIKFEDRYLLYDCKSSQEAYDLPIGDRRAFNEYVRDYNKMLEHERKYVRSLIIISNEFASNCSEKCREFEESLEEETKRPVKVAMITTSALKRLVELSIAFGFRKEVLGRLSGVVTTDLIERILRRP